MSDDIRLQKDYKVPEPEKLNKIDYIIIEDQ